MDAIHAANLKAFVAHAPKNGQDKGEPAAIATRFERKQLSDARRARGNLSFMERMEADSDKKQAYSHVVAMRENRAQRKALDAMVKKLRPEPEQKGPKIVSHDGASLFEGHDRKLEWAPLEYY
eukprot:TRINITY_DN95281_c0_g1_i1.p1 TRINITY_DN95281_c0_g1~~TRINITY_DN95281_c0_g1_i1.p1  ORF type:complete len:123 (-),score=30.61 TRINITY_DN95281_c0_g1_i1:395-763(-)